MSTLYIVADIAHYDKENDRSMIERDKQVSLGNFIRQTCVFRNTVHYKKTIPRKLRNQTTDMTDTIIENNSILKNRISHKWVI
jgi:hypothetical protein